MSDRVVDNVIIRNAGVIYGDKSLGILGRNHEGPIRAIECHRTASRFAISSVIDC
jgi:hypothetical protein